MQPSKPQIFVVDDDADSRESIRAMVEAMKHDARTFESAEHFLATYNGEPGCLVTDLRMPGMNAIELMEAMHAASYILPTIVISAYAEVPVTVSAMKRGAITLLEKPYHRNELWAAIRLALQQCGETHALSVKLRDVRQRIASLTPVELRIMDMVVDGVQNKQIAFELDMGLRTIESRRRSTFRKMGVDSLANLIRKVIVARPINAESEVEGLSLSCAN